MANVVDLRRVKFGLVKYGEECAITRIDVLGLLIDSRIVWTFELMFEVNPSAQGVDGKGNRASGHALAAVISDPSQAKLLYPLVEIGDTILTPYGNYRVEWYSQTNHDNLTLIES